ncbi:hypothetical protein IE53DRAFT_387683 [Violaceomyces palustris]|uniref:Uncharacterized protein n=1 Tax=Violaceomyces palustris TaxID=1673888 RepID=A0ACD0NWE9_9BASI|nr:hypothetical protein IE53DRAFT_387683 [Violaceomyces palustris]
MSIHRSIPPAYLSPSKRAPAIFAVSTLGKSSASSTARDDSQNNLALLGIPELPYGSSCFHGLG